MPPSLVLTVLAGTFTWLERVAWGVLICSLVAAFTSVLWSKSTSSIPRQQDNDSTKATGPEGGASRQELGYAMEDVAVAPQRKSVRTHSTTKVDPDRENGASTVAAPKRKLSRADYTVGWICAISAEHVASQAFLDEEHEGPEDVPNKDDNDYTLGRVGKHNVVIVVLPIGEYGLASAAGVAKDLSHGFPNLRIGLMVGIGGGAPSQKHDIRLGDIVVSAPGNGNGGVFQYDFGKTMQDGTFHMTGFLNQPPTSLRTAVNGLRTQYTSKGNQLEEAINSVLSRNPRLQEFARPHFSTDRLYRAEVAHPLNTEASCTICCGNDPIKLVSRYERTEDEDNPAIHYGVIASANQVMKNAFIRDKLIADKDVLCFEMEAAGLMNHFPCLVIRGICDYSDSHKNKRWQGYAAMAAAAYAKDILYRVPPSSLTAEKRIGEVLSGLHEVSREQLENIKQLVQVQKDYAKERLSEIEEKCHQLFRLTTTDGSDATYEWHKDRVEQRVAGTCQWFLEHDNFREWLQRDSGPLLVSADPGCGKSVLAKYLIDHGLPRSSTICYFFFKDPDQNRVRQALCALLHQLLSQKPALIDHVVSQFHKDGQALIHSTQSLWTIFGNAVKDPRAGPVMVVLDALDECAESDFENLVRNVKQQLSSDQRDHGKLKYLLTCRPYENIVSQFRDRDLLAAFPNIRIPGEEESEAISQEVNHVITYRVNQLSEKMGLSHDIQSHLEKRLQMTTHRTYLWVYLVFDYLERENFRRTRKGVESTIATLPRSINEAYERILSKSKVEERPMVRKALSIILASSRPLTLSEMNIALNIDNTSQSMDDLDLEDENDFKFRLRSWCGLFVSIHYGKVYFLHQTAREFLLSDLGQDQTIPVGLQWHHSIVAQHAHNVLTESCLLYLNFFNANVDLPIDASDEAGHAVEPYAFLDYAANAWGAHFRKAGVVRDAAVTRIALAICDSNSKSYSTWFKVYWKAISLQNPPHHFTDIMVASHFGHAAIVALLLQKGATVDSKDSFGRTPLSWAATNGHKAVVKLLLDNGAVIDVTDNYGRTPLSWAAAKGQEAVARLLLDSGAVVDAEDSNYSRTPLSWAAATGHEAMARMLLQSGAEVDMKSYSGQTALSGAAANGHEAVVRLLLDNGAAVDSKDSSNLSPLLWAAAKGHEPVVRLLLDRGASINSKDYMGQTPLWEAAAKGHEAVVRLLLEKGATVDSKDNLGQTPLFTAAGNGHEAVVRLLLEKGAAVDSKDASDQTPALAAAANGHDAVVKLVNQKA